MRKILTIIFSVYIFFNMVSCAFAEEGTSLISNSPTSVPNNKFGIHIIDENDLKNAASLVNSSGGDWGYVTIVITESERNHDRWQNVFDQMRRLHVIPIVRIATKVEGENWSVPKTEDIDSWVSFLDSLNWVVENRYVIVGNEPNHTSEWGGKIDPEGYATYLNDFAQKLRKSSSDYFVMGAGLDASAKNTTNTMDEALFIKKMLSAQPTVFDNLAGWVSHSYPNPGFEGKETDTGRGSIQTFDWELSYLDSLGVSKSLPVFITETGWSTQKVDAEKISQMYEYAFQNVWSDKRIVAVTPFVLNYKDSLFSEFSWTKDDGTYYPFFEKYRSITKTKGKPIQTQSGQIAGALAQPLIVEGSDFIGAVLAKNTGQSIWTNENLTLVADNEDIIFKNSLLFDIEPTKTGLIVFRATPTQTRGLLLKSIYLADKESGKRVSNSFPIEAFIVKADKMQMQSIFDKLLGFVKSEQFLNTSK